MSANGSDYVQLKRDKMCQLLLEGQTSTRIIMNLSGASYSTVTREKGAFMAARSLPMTGRAYPRA